MKTLNIKFYILNSHRGQVMIEALVALAVLTVGFVGILALLSRSLSLNRVIGDSYRATYLAAEGIEVVKNIIDTNIIAIIAGAAIPWNDGFIDGELEVQFNTAKADMSYCAGGCSPLSSLNFDPTTSLYFYAAPESTRFTRLVTTQLINIGASSDAIRVVSRVEWPARGGGMSNIELEDYFYNWR